jgi:hypothetical protein
MAEDVATEEGGLLKGLRVSYEGHRWRAQQLAYWGFPVFAAKIVLLVSCFEGDEKKLREKGSQLWNNDLTFPLVTSVNSLPSFSSHRPLLFSNLPASFVHARYSPASERPH